VLLPWWVTANSAEGFTCRLASPAFHLPCMLSPTVCCSRLTMLGARLLVVHFVLQHAALLVHWAPAGSQLSSCIACWSLGNACRPPRAVPSQVIPPLNRCSPLMLQEPPSNVVTKQIAGGRRPARRGGWIGAGGPERGTALQEWSWESGSRWCPAGWGQAGASAVPVAPACCSDEQPAAAAGLGCLSTRASCPREQVQLGSNAAAWAGMLV
jgi:hypothetical protein